MRLPTYLNVSKATTKALNLNIYRNLHYHHLNKQKQNFHDEVKKLLADVPRANEIAIHYTIYAPRNGRLDTMNVGSIVDKYFSDTLVETGKIPDDDYKHIVFNSFSFGSVCPMDGHAEATIYILERSTPMRVLLDQSDIEDALNVWVDNAGFPGANGVELTVEDGKVTAEVTFADGEDNEDEPEVQPKKKGRGGRPKGSKNKPKPVVKQEATDVVGTSETSGDDGTSGGSDASETTDAGQPEEDEKIPSKNLFTEPEEESSESTDKTEEVSGSVAGKSVKRSSIFDD